MTVPLSVPVNVKHAQHFAHPHFIIDCPVIAAILLEVRDVIAAGWYSASG